ncbi:hypothetical protein NQZ68_023763 [Dissostichus eleginoides]|nr:hypothetical protein NQZ68_023763 [Dissostichus eleginoides]
MERWRGCIAASTTKIKHGFMRRPSSQDSQQLEKPHLLPWSGAKATARPEKASSFLYHKRKGDFRRGGEENGFEGSSKREAVFMGSELPASVYHAEPLTHIEPNHTSLAGLQQFMN